MTIIQEQLQSIVAILQVIKSLQPSYADAVRKRGNEVIKNGYGPIRDKFSGRQQYEQRRPVQDTREHGGRVI